MNTVVEVKNLTVRFGDFSAVKNVSFEVARGEIFGFLGANGAGKTTTIRVLCGLLEPTEGEVRVAGLNFSGGGLELKKKVGYMSQKFTLYDDLTVGENLEFTAQLRKLERATFEKKRRELLEFISFDHGLDTMVKDLPGGIKQQVSLAAALLHDPEVIFLDEPTAGVTPAARARFWALIRELSSRGRTVFVTTHYMDEAEQCGRIALMRAGELIALDPPAVLKKSVFPRGLVELEPRASNEETQKALSGSVRLSAHLSSERVETSGYRTHADMIKHLAHHPAFSLFEPYGMRFHAEVADLSEWANLRPELERQFILREIDPTLEDVFIRLVEGRRVERRSR